MQKETVGAYGYVTADWKEKDLPLDLWLEWTLQLFDRVVLALYDDVKLPNGFGRNPRLKTLRMRQPLITSFRFSTEGKAAAQKALNTDWKMMTDVDEFLPCRLDTSRLNKKYAYPIRYHHLYGNANTEIHDTYHVLPKYKYVIHHTDRAVLGDGASVEPPYFLGVKKRILYSIIDTDLIAAYKSVPPIAFDVWHTGTIRNPKALNKKWHIQTDREIRNRPLGEGERFLRSLPDVEESFDFKEYKTIWPKSYLTHVQDRELPEIIRNNKKRFLWVKSWDEPGKKSH